MKRSLTILWVLFAGVWTTQAQTLFTDDNGGLYEGVYERKNATGVTEASYEVSSGRLNGEATFYHANGNVRERGLFSEGKRHGIWNSYNAEGKVLSKVQFKDGKKHGTWFLWDENGTLRYEMHYKNGEKTGIWKMWDASGNLTEKRKF